MKALAITLLVVGCSGGCSGKSREPGPGSEPLTAPATPKAAVAGPPRCKLDPSWTAAVAGWPALLGDAVVSVTVTPERGIAIAQPDGGELGHAALPESATFSIAAVKPAQRGLVVIASARTGERGGSYWLARFDGKGAAIGAPVELPATVAPYPLPGLDVVALDDKIALLEETKLLKHAQVQIIDLTGKPLGPAVDAEAGRFSSATTRVGKTHEIAALLRDSEGGDERVRVFDADKNAWVAPVLPLGGDPIYGAAPLGPDGAVLMRVASADGGAILGARIGTDGTLGAWKTWVKDAGRTLTAHGIHAAADGSRVYFDYAVKTGDKVEVYFGTVDANVEAALDTAGSPGDELGENATLATRDSVYVPHEGAMRRYRCE